MLQIASMTLVAIQLLFIWLLILLAAVTACHLIARDALGRTEGGPSDDA